MPVRALATDKLEESLRGESPSLVMTPMGLAMVEIQGELNVPHTKPVGLAPEEEALFKTHQLPPFLRADGPVDTVKIGHVDLDIPAMSATLFVSTTQRLVGKIVKLDPPLGVLRLGKDESDPCEMVDVVKTKLIFSSRPLPIM